MGRAKVYHFSGLRPVNNETIDERMSRLNTQFPQSKPIFLACIENWLVWLFMCWRISAKLGLDTGFDPLTINNNYFKNCEAGREQDIMYPNFKVLVLSRSR